MIISHCQPCRDPDPPPLFTLPSILKTLNFFSLRSKDGLGGSLANCGFINYDDAKDSEADLLGW